MRFFTRRWATGELPTHESEAVLARYEYHLAHLAPNLPASVRVLARELVLHDARLRHARYDRAGRELRIALRAGDERLGWYDLELVYQGVILDQADVTALTRAAALLEPAIWHDEVDVAGEGHFLHRLLFWPGDEECEVMFRTLALTIQPHPGYPPVPGTATFDG
jgi:hypothetical protein